MRKFWCLIWLIIIFCGSACGNAVPTEAKYITGFIVGCLAMAALRLAHND